MQLCHCQPTLQPDLPAPCHPHIPDDSHISLMHASQNESWAFFSSPGITKNKSAPVTAWPRWVFLKVPDVNSPEILRTKGHRCGTRQRSSSPISVKHVRIQRVLSKHTRCHSVSLSVLFGNNTLMPCIQK